jgi:hypothetical protein
MLNAARKSTRCLGIPTSLIDAVVVMIMWVLIYASKGMSGRRTDTDGSADQEAATKK